MIKHTDHVKIEVLHRVQDERSMLHATKSRKYIVKHVIERKNDGRIRVTEGGKEYVSNYWMILRKREDTGN